MWESTPLERYNTHENTVTQEQCMVFTTWPHLAWSGVRTSQKLYQLLRNTAGLMAIWSTPSRLPPSSDIDGVTVPWALWRVPMRSLAVWPQCSAWENIGIILNILRFSDPPESFSDNHSFPITRMAPTHSYIVSTNYFLPAISSNSVTIYQTGYQLKVNQSMGSVGINHVAFIWN